ncbi:MAG TPA: hypothetical protein VLT51_05865 [Anaerolineales bacterium]|nr:hypothetical protein [Anaerolineales bacterium]
MRKYDPRLIIGGLLLFGGLLSLLDAMGIIGNAGGIFWGLIWGAVGVFFLYLLTTDKSRNWWAAFPGFTFIGMALSAFLPESLQAFSGLLFFAGISLAFLWVYFTDTTRWWAIIPAGVLLTLGAVSALDEISNFDTGGVLFVGLGLTFALVALLPGGNQRSWAFIPAVILMIFGTLLVPSFGLANYVGPALLILLGGYFVFRFFRAGT